MVNYHASSPRQEDRSPATRRLLALRTALTRIPPCRLFLVTSLDALRSTSFRWSSSLSFGGELGCWPSHRWRGVDGRRGCCRFVRMVLVEQADELPKVLDR